MTDPWKSLRRPGMGVAPPGTHPTGGMLPPDPGKRGLDIAAFFPCITPLRGGRGGIMPPGEEVQEGPRPSWPPEA